MEHERLIAFSETTERPGHINEPHRPIFTTVEDLERISDSNVAKIYNYLKKTSPKELARVHYGIHTNEQLRQAGMIQGYYGNGRFFVVSDVDSRNKFSEDYKTCHGLVLSGETTDGERISSMFHINPKIMQTTESFDSLLTALKYILTEIKLNCVDGSIDTVTYGGLAAFKSEAPRALDSSTSAAADYKTMYDSLNNLVDDVLGFRLRIAEPPQVAAAADGTGYKTIAFFDNKTNHLHLIRYNSDQHSGQSIQSEDLVNKLEEWRQNG